MGLTSIDLDIANPAKPKQRARVEFLIDTGAYYSVVPASVLRKLGIKPHSKRTFTLADGSKITRRIGDVQFRFDGRQGASPVIFGEKDDSILLGSVSLEALGLMIDPLKRQLRPLPMVLARLDTGSNVPLARTRKVPQTLESRSALPNSDGACILCLHRLQ